MPLHSLVGFRQTHNDLSGRTLSPRGAAIRPEFGFATEMAGVAAANTNNGIGIAGIDRQAMLRSYSVLRNAQTGDNPNNILEFTNDTGGTERFYLDLDTFSQRVSEARSDGADVHLFEYGLPTAAANGFPTTTINTTTLAVSWPNPSLPPGQRAFFAGEVRQTANTIFDALCFGSGCASPPNPLSLLRGAVINAAIEDDAVIVAPAGDAVDGWNPLEGYTPNRVGKYSVGVGGVVEGSAGELLAWSGTLPSPFVDVAGYAEGVVGLSGDANDAYMTFEGTAPAAAIVGGVAGLLKAEKPDLTGEEIEGILRLTATDAGTAGFDEATGAGAVDAGEALRYVRDNEFARETSSGVTVLTDDLYFTDLVELQGFCRFYNGPGYCTLTTGKLRRFTARIDFPSSISPSSAPDVFVRWAESDGTDNMWWYNSNNWYTRYDPFVKSLSITSASAEGFEIEGFYWDASFYDVRPGLLGRGSVPKRPQDFTVAYTVAGSQVTPPPAPFSAYIDGPASVGVGQRATWDSNPSGGTTPYSYRWHKRYVTPDCPANCFPDDNGYCTQAGPQCGGDFQLAATSRRLTTQFSPGGQIELALVVTDGGGTKRTHGYVVTVGSNRPEGGSSDELRAEDGAPQTDAGTAASRARPGEVSLSAFPNPFASATAVRFGLPGRADVTLAVYDALGREVARLADGPAEAGWHSASFDASRLPSGVYVVRLTAGSSVRTQRVTVLR